MLYNKLYPKKCDGAIPSKSEGIPVTPHKIDNFLTGWCKNKKASYTLYQERMF